MIAQRKIQIVNETKYHEQYIAKWVDELIVYKH